MTYPPFLQKFYEVLVFENKRKKECGKFVIRNCLDKMFFSQFFRYFSWIFQHS
jgi:hypothetical protein